MIPVIDFARAEAMQRQVESQRRDHRDRLKVVEVRDQCLKRLLKTGKAYQEAIDSAPVELLAELGLRAGDEEKGEPVLLEMPVPFTPAIDYPDSHPVVAPVKDLSAVLFTGGMVSATENPAPAIESETRELPARPNARKVRDLADGVLEILQSLRCGSTASIDMEELYGRTGKSKGAVDAALQDLTDRGLIRKVRAAERGHLTVILKAPVAA